MDDFLDTLKKSKKSTIHYTANIVRKYVSWGWVSNIYVYIYVHIFLGDEIVYICICIGDEIYLYRGIYLFIS